MQIDISGMNWDFTSISEDSGEISGEITALVTPDDERRLLLYCIVIHMFRLGAKANPKVAYLACHAKTQRARIKNLRRLYKLGCSVYRYRIFVHKQNDKTKSQ